MHQFIVNASIQILPLTQGVHPYTWVDEAILVIQQSGLKCEVGPFATQVEGTYAEVMKLVDSVNEYLFSKGCTEWICSTQVQLRHDRDITADEKTKAYRQ